MPKPPVGNQEAMREWWRTHGDYVLLAMWQDKTNSLTKIARRLGVSKNSVGARARRIHAPARGTLIIRIDPAAVSPVIADPEYDRRAAMPPGHPVSWGAISNQPWPG